RRQQADSQLMEMQERLSSYERQNQQLAIQQKTVELQTALSKPEVQSFAEAYNRHNANSPHKLTFEQEVIRLGQWYEASAQRSPTADELVSELVNKYGFQMQASQPQQASPQQSQSLPVIPVVKGGSSS